MGDKAELLTQLGVPDDVANGIETGLKYSSLVGDVFSAYSTGKSVLQLFGVIEDDHSLQDIKDGLDKIEKKIDTVLHDLEAEALGASRQQMRTAIADKVAEATTSVHAGEGYVKASNDEQQQAVFALAIRDSANAVTALEDGAYWTQVFSSRVFYDDPWSKTMFPPDAPEGNLVFDYRCALPAYLTALLARIVVLTAADPTFKSQLVAEIEERANRKKGIHDQILAAFAFITVLTSWVLFNFINRYKKKDIPNFLRNDDDGSPLGSGDRNNPDAANRTYDMFVLKHELRTRWQSISLYRKVGLLHVWGIIAKLCGMLQRSPPDIPQQLRKYARLSMRDAYAEFPTWLKQTPTSLKQMCGVLNVPSPHSLSKLFSS
jgi:hypothetical protein